MSSEDLSSRYQAISQRVENASRLAGRTDIPTLIAVSKGQSVEAIEALYNLGHRDFGENYAQELLEKAEELRARGCDALRWHFIGHLQTNKVRLLLPWIHAIHTLDTEKLAKEVESRWKALGKTGRFPVFAEVNIDDEVSKSGFLAQNAARFLKEVAQKFPSLEFRGLMCVPAAKSDSEGLRRTFARLRELESSCRPLTCGALSMGMSSDFEIAIAEGATHVRVGTALFGPRVGKG